MLKVIKALDENVCIFYAMMNDKSISVSIMYLEKYFLMWPFQGTNSINLCKNNNPKSIIK